LNNFIIVSQCDGERIYEWQRTVATEVGHMTVTTWQIFIHTTHSHTI